MTVTSDIQTLQNQTAYNQLTSRTDTKTSDKDMFLSLMLQQMQNQDPTAPMDNQQWLSQLAQYSSLEQMTQMNEGINSLASSLNSLSEGVYQSSGISQTLSLIGKEVDIITDPENPESIVSGSVTEATFDDGAGQVKVNGKYYPISQIQSVREPSIN